MLPFLSSRLPFPVHLWLAAKLMPQVIKHKELADILARSTPRASDRNYSGLQAPEIIKAVQAVVAKPWRMRGRRCLREGLLAFHFLKLAGFKPVLRFGVIKQSFVSGHPKAHCWVLVDDQILLNPPIEPMVHLFDYDGLSKAATATTSLWSSTKYD